MQDISFMAPGNGCQKYRYTWTVPGNSAQNVCKVIGDGPDD